MGFTTWEELGVDPTQMAGGEDHDRPWYSAGKDVLGVEDYWKHEPDFMKGFNKLSQDYFQETARQGRIGEAFRPIEVQRQARKHWEETGKNLAGQTVPHMAKPGKSNHGKFRALDIDRNFAKWITKKGGNAFLEKYGLSRPMDDEPWHVEPYRSTTSKVLSAVKGGLDEATSWFGSTLGAGTEAVAQAHGAEPWGEEGRQGAELAGRQVMHGVRSGILPFLQPPEDIMAEKAQLDQEMGGPWWMMSPMTAGGLYGMVPGFKMLEKAGSKLLSGGLLSDLFAPTAAHSALNTLLGYGALQGLGMEGFSRNAPLRMLEEAVSAAQFGPIAPLAEISALHPAMRPKAPTTMQIGKAKAEFAARGGLKPRLSDEPIPVQPTGEAMYGEAPVPMVPQEPPAMYSPLPPRSPWEPQPELMDTYHTWRRPVEPEPARVGPGGEVLMPGQEAGVPAVVPQPQYQLGQPALPFLRPQPQPGTVGAPWSVTPGGEARPLPYTEPPSSPWPWSGPDVLGPRPTGPGPEPGGVPALRPEPEVPVVPRDLEIPRDVTPTTADVVTEEVIPAQKEARRATKASKRKAAGKKAPPGETAQPPKTTTEPEMTPALRSVDTKIRKIDQQLETMAQTGIADETNPNFRLLQGKRAVLTEKFRAMAEDHLKGEPVDPTFDVREDLPPEAFDVGAWLEAKPEPPAPAGAEAVPEPVSPETPVSPTGETAPTGELVGYVDGEPVYAEPLLKPGPIAAPKAAPAGEMAVPTKVGTRTRPNGIRHDYVIIPPEARGEPYRLVNNMYDPEGNIMSSGLIRSGDHKTVMAELDPKVNPEFGLVERVNEPLQSADTKPMKAISEEAQAFLEGQEVPDLEAPPVEEPVVMTKRKAPRPEVTGRKGKAKAEAKKRAKGTTEKGLTARQQADAEFVEEAFKDNEKALQERKALGSLKQLYYKAKTQWVDFAADTKRILRDAGDYGQEAIMLRDLAAGSSPKAEHVYNQVEKAVYSGLDPARSDLLNRVCCARRIMAVDESIAKKNVARRAAGKPELPDHKHPRGLNGRQCREWLNTLPEDLRQDMMARSQRLYDAFDDLLTELERERIFTPEEARRIRDASNFYIPREFLHHIDGDVYNFHAGGDVITVNGSGLKPLKQGSHEFLELDAKKLFLEYANRVYGRIYRNRANRAMMDIADYAPEHGIARRVGPNEKVDPRETVIHLVDREGNKVRLALPNDVASGWMLSNPQLSEMTAKLFKTISCTPLLKALATGYNPAFGLANLPRDIVHVFFTTFEYSANPIRFAAQMAGDLKATWRDAFFKTGDYLKYLDEGGGMQLMTKQGQGNILGKLIGEKKARKAQDVMGWVGETSEMWTRLALRRRAILNGKSPTEATWIARNYLDFSQGGGMAKSADNLIPYFNASVQGARGIGRAAMERPGLMAWKVANIGALASGLFLYNHLVNPEAMEQMSHQTQANYWCFPMPDVFSYKDQAGNKRQLVFTIPKDQFSRVVSTIFESALAQGLGLKTYDASYIGGAMMDFLPMIQGQNLPPSFKAYMGVKGNWDPWRQAQIWKGPNVKASEEYYTGRMGRDPTHPLLVAWGKLSGMSPVRTGFALQQILTGTNPFMLLPVEAARVALGGLNNKDRELIFSELVAKTPVLSRFIKTTSPYSAYGEKTAQYAQDVNTERLIMRRNLDELAEIYYRDPTRENKEVVNRFIREQDKIDRQGLKDRFKFNKQVFDYPDRDWWLHTYSLPAEAKAQAFMDRYNQLSNNPQGQAELRHNAFKLKGYAGDKFRTYLRRIMRKQERGEASGG